MSAAAPATTAPQSVVVSYWLYIVGAVLGVLGVVVSLVALPAAITAAESQLNRSLQGQSTNGVDVSALATGTAITAVVIGALFAIVFTVLTIVFARKMRQGRNWARIVLAVFAALQIFGVLNNFGVGALHFIVVLVALILSFLPTSNAWFRSVRDGAATSAATTL